jgi:L-lactate permease
MVGRQLPFFAVLVPFWLICRASSWPGPATGQQGDEVELLRYGFWHSVALGCLMGVLVFLQSDLLSRMIPG